jgi:hypothetical protein
MEQPAGPAAFSGASIAFPGALHLLRRPLRLLVDAPPHGLELVRGRGGDVLDGGLGDPLSGLDLVLLG